MDHTIYRALWALYQRGWLKTEESGRRGSSSLQIWLRRRILFAFSDEMCNDLAPFGGAMRS